MKKINLKIKMLVLLGFFTVNASINAQIAINEDDSDGSAGAELDVKSTTKGVLFPVLTLAERDAIQSPAAGLLIFNRSGGYYNFYNGTNWVQINRTVATIASNPTAGTGTDVGVGVGVANPDNSAILHVNTLTKGFLLPRFNGAAHASSVAGIVYFNTSSKKVVFYDGTTYQETNSTLSTAGAGGSGTAEGVLIGTGTIDQSAKMEVKTTANKGMLLPRMSNGQRDAIDSPAEGLVIYSTTDGNIQYYSGATWYFWAFGPSQYGKINTEPGTSCSDIYNTNPTTVGVDGTYWIDTDGVGGNAAYQCTCDMVRNGGGWTLVENTGPAGTNTGTTTSVGATPITKAQAGFAKFSDTDINLLRGTLATSVMWIERQNSCSATPSIFFKSALSFAANSTGAGVIRTYYITYANAVNNTSLQTGTSAYTTGFDSWDGGTAGYRIIFNYGTEGVITNGCNSACSGNRSECNVLFWVK